MDFSERNGKKLNKIAWKWKPEKTHRLRQGKYLCGRWKKHAGVLPWWSFKSTAAPYCSNTKMVSKLSDWIAWCKAVWPWNERETIRMKIKIVTSEFVVPARTCWFIACIHIDALLKLHWKAQVKFVIFRQFMDFIWLNIELTSFKSHSTISYRLHSAATWIAKYP